MVLTNKTDEELMVLYQNGTEAAFQELYGRHSAKVFSYINARMQNKERAHDIFQEVFVKIHKSKHLYNKTLPVLPWMFTVTKNAMIDEVRKSKYEKSQMVVEDANLSGPEPESNPSSQQEVSSFIQELPACQRQAIEMRYYEEKTFDEIASILKTSPLNVRQLVSRGVKRLKELIQEGEKP